MVNQALVATLNSVLGNGKKTSKGNFAYHCPFCNHHKPKLEVNLLTDPPYGINANKQTLGTGKKQFHRGDNWDVEVPDFYYILALVNKAIIWGGNYFADKLPINNTSPTI